MTTRFPSSGAVRVTVKTPGVPLNSAVLPVVAAIVTTGGGSSSIVTVAESGEPMTYADDAARVATTLSEALLSSFRSSSGDTLNVAEACPAAIVTAPDSDE